MSEENKTTAIQRYEYLPDIGESSGGPNAIQVFQYTPTSKKEPVCAAGAVGLGDLYLSDGSANLGKKFRMAAFFRWPRRAYQPQGGEAPCYSPNGTIGTVYGECNSCPRGSWEIAKKEGLKSPPCKAIDTYLGLYDGKIISIDFKGASKASATALHISKARSKRNYFERLVEVNTFKAPGAAYFVRTVNFTEEEPTEDIKARCFELARQFRADFLKSGNYINEARQSEDDTPF